MDHLNLLRKRLRAGCVSGGTQDTDVQGSEGCVYTENDLGSQPTWGDVRVGAKFLRDRYPASTNVVHSDPKAGGESIKT